MLHLAFSPHDSHFSWHQSKWILQEFRLFYPDRNALRRLSGQPSASHWSISARFHRTSVPSFTGLGMRPESAI
jgi:hypothetical protein